MPRSTRGKCVDSARPKAMHAFAARLRNVSRCGERGTSGAPFASVRGFLTLLIVLATKAHANECERVSVWRDGKAADTVCRADANARGLTVVDLGEDWTPSVLGAGPAYRATYLALAQERFVDAGLDGELAKRDRYLELFGILPTFGVVGARLADDARHACHDAIDDAPLGAAPARIAEESAAAGRGRIARARKLHAELEHERVRKKLADLDALAATSSYYRRALDRLNVLDAYIGTIRAVQAHLACDQLLGSPAIDGAYTWQTSNAVAVFQRGAMILPTGILDAQTREALLQGSRERDVRAALRVLRERVIDAAGIVEDGTAGAGERMVLGRQLVPEATWRVRGHDALPDAAPDLVSSATEAAARALGWTDATTVRAFLDALASDETTSRLVAVQLPARPAYHAAVMNLSVEIDRGDVWQNARRRDSARRPALILYTTFNDRRIPLARWPTTIGGWQQQKVDGDVEKRWKESPVGPRIWRDLYIGPSWLPPLSTPDRELVRRTDDHYVLAREQFGPSYHAAFGMVAFFHLVEDRDLDKVEYWDQGIRTHGTGNLVSLANGVSHGCHRLLGLHVVRLADFVLAHREHIRRGDTPTYYRRVVRSRGRFPLAIDSLGYRIEIVPPIPINVLPGRVHR